MLIAKDDSLSFVELLVWFGSLTESVLFPDHGSLTTYVLLDNHGSLSSTVLIMLCGPLGVFVFFQHPGFTEVNTDKYDRPPEPRLRNETQFPKTPKSHRGR